MKIYRLLFLAIILGLAQNVYGTAVKNDCAPVDTQNLITNGSFEKVALEPDEAFRFTRDILGWSVFGGGTGELSNSGDANSGRQMLELATTHGYKIAQTIKTQPGKRYLLRFWSKFRKPQYNELNIVLDNHPEWACGTTNQLTLTIEGHWKEYGYILCPDTHHVTIEFGQQRETGGGYGIHLDDVSLVPCHVGRPTSATLTFLHQTWVHSHEEGNESIIVWRKAGSRQFPPSRFRRTLSLYKGGQCQFLSLESNDAHHRKVCSWSFDPGSNKLNIRESTGQVAGSYKLDSLSDGLLSLHK